MWKRIVDILRCPCCQNHIELFPVEERRINLKTVDYEKGEALHIHPNNLDEYVESGMLFCSNCKNWYPILYGLPVLLSYETAITKQFLEKHINIIKKVGESYTSPKEIPKPGEEFVLRSFSKEWMEYDYDGVIWGWSYEDRKKTLLIEMGCAPGELHRMNFLEVGCGIGITTSSAQEIYGGDAVGVDLSLSVLKATDYFRGNPFLHFIQTSLYQIPLKMNHFDLLYSHGVLHHTYSTKEAFKAISPYCKPGGWTYIWVYGRGGQVSSWDRKLGHYAELLFRPFLSRAPTTIATTLLAPIALGYILLNAIFKHRNPTLQAYNFKRALHAARDRFTPRFAFRHDYDEVESWFKEFGFGKIKKVDWRMVPPAVHKLFRGSIGVRGQRKLIQ